ncbi:MAG: glutaminyl-peptide cyclotransferase [Rhodococcus sp.]|nr:glutaminyl-peptide cyclotransferase [Rhodococcus sp. (in: high G+C Gram-positive bacteria)]
MTDLRPLRSNRRIAPVIALAVSLLGASVTACDSQAAQPEDQTSNQLQTEIVDTLPHDPEAFTQGLEIADGALYEGTGIAGESWLRVSDFPEGTIRTTVDLPGQLFGEGITVTDESVWQLTWRDGVAIERDRHSLTELRRVEYAGEGWGICALPDRLVTSDGSATLTFRDRGTFDEIGSVQVTDGSASVDRLNELECAEDGSVYANVWTTDTIVRIDPNTGRVSAAIDATPVRNALPEETPNIDVLNGIAQIPGTDRFLVTGKYWPSMFVVRFVTKP